MDRMKNTNVSKVAKGAVIVAGGLAIGNLAMGQAVDIQNLAVPLRAAESIIGGLFILGGTVKGGIMIGVGLVGMLREGKKSTAPLFELQRKDETTDLSTQSLRLKH